MKMNCASSWLFTRTTVEEYGKKYIQIYLRANKTTSQSTLD